MEIKVKKRYIRPEVESLDMDTYVICDGWSVNKGKGTVDEDDEFESSSRQGDFMDLEESDYDY